MKRENYDRGRRIIVYTDETPEIRGWLYGKIGDDIYIALDEEGKDIRFIPGKLSANITTAFTEPRAQFVEEKELLAIDQAAKFGEEQRERLEQILQNLDYNRIRGIARDFNRFKKIRRDLGPFERIPIDDKFDQILSIWSTNNQLVEEAQRSGLLSILTEHQKQIGTFTTHATLPCTEAWLFKSREITELVNNAANGNDLAQLSPQHLQKVSTKAIAEAYLSEEAESNTEEKESHGEKKRSRRLRIFAAAGKIVVGGLFASANIALGVLSGTLTTLPTLASGEIDAVNGVVTSAYTGSKTLLDGVKEFADAIDFGKK